jgi:hypothetical protein
MQITITKPTSMPGEVTSVTAWLPSDTVGDVRLGISRITRAIDWRLRTENEKKLENTRRNLRKHGLRLPGF